MINPVVPTFPNRKNSHVRHSDTLPRCLDRVPLRTMRCMRNGTTVHNSLLRMLAPHLKKHVDALSNPRVVSGTKARMTLTIMPQSSRTPDDKQSQKHNQICTVKHSSHILYNQTRRSNVTTKTSHFIRCTNPTVPRSSVCSFRCYSEQ